VPIAARSGADYDDHFDWLQGFFGESSGVSICMLLLSYCIWIQFFLFRNTYEGTVDQTIRETPKETINKPYAELIIPNQMANKKEISVVFSFAFVYLVIILMIS